jgi:hypothetical protein
MTWQVSIIVSLQRYNKKHVNRHIHIIKHATQILATHDDNVLKLYIAIYTKSLFRFSNVSCRNHNIYCTILHCSREFKIEQDMRTDNRWRYEMFMKKYKILRKGCIWSYHKQPKFKSKCHFLFSPKLTPYFCIYLASQPRTL